MIWGTQWDAMVNFIGDHTVTAPGSRYLTGADEYADKSKNVYDTSTGAVYEWTATAYYTLYRAFRGGIYYYASASSNRGYNSAHSTSTDYGTRAQLYIKNWALVALWRDESSFRVENWVIEYRDSANANRDCVKISVWIFIKYLKKVVWYSTICHITFFKQN